MDFSTDPTVGPKA